MKIGIGITTFNRPNNIQLVLDSLRELDRSEYIIIVAKDGNMEYPVLNNVQFIDSEEQKGVSVTKNKCLTFLMDSGCDYIFLMDDDLVVDVEVFKYFIETSKVTGIEHLQYGNIDNNKIITSVVYNPQGQGIHIRSHCKGAFLFFTRSIIEKVGYFDEGFINALEHVEMTYRCMKEEGFPFWYFFEPINANKFIREIEGESTITDKNKYLENKEISFKHWFSKYQFNLKDIPYLPLSNVVEILKSKKP